MAEQRKDIEADIAPGDEPVRADYERDFYSWLMEQARHLREGRFAALDRDNLAEEIESLGREQFNKLVSALRVAMLHMLKWDHQPSLRSRSWVLSIEEQRLEIADVLADNPGLKPRIAEAVARAYRRARIEAAKETGLDETAFPATCPYSFDDIVSRAFTR
jgi:predicted DNA-binding ribbon-helix-helix protein